MNIFDSKGYLDYNSIMSIDKPFIFIIGARGTGKTYGALDYAINNCTPFLYMRRTQNQIELLSKEALNPFNTLNCDKEYNIIPTKLNKYLTNFVIEDKVIATMLALSTVSSIRGFDASQYDTLIFDEFIQERHERKIKNEGLAFLNAYETINRNRELNGRKPLRCLMLGNSNTIYSDIMYQFGILHEVGKMAQKKQTIKILSDKPIAIIISRDSPVSGEKANTVLYQIGNDMFNNMAIENNFDNTDFDFVRAENVKEFVPLCALDDLTIFKHKSKNKYYIVRKKFECKEHYTLPKDFAKFKQKYYFLYNAYEFGLISFADVEAKIKFLSYL